MTLRCRISSNRTGGVERPPGHAGESVDELEVLGVVARHVVGQLEKADHRIAGHERHGELDW